MSESLTCLLTQNGHLLSENQRLMNEVAVSKNSRSGSNVSGLTHGYGNGPICPDHLPREVLWNECDAKKDPTSGTKKDGTFVSDEEYLTIRATGKAVKNKLLALKVPKKFRGAKNTYILLKSLFPMEWLNGLEELEETHKELALYSEPEDSNITDLPPAAPNPKRRQQGNSQHISKKKAQTEASLPSKGTGPDGRDVSGSPPFDIAPSHQTQQVPQMKLPTFTSQPSSSLNPPANSLQIGLDNPLKTDNVDVGFIKVDAHIDNLIHVFSVNFPALNDATELLKAIKLTPDFGPSTAPSDDVAAFIEQLETADPNSPHLSENDDNELWGHHQFTSSVGHSGCVSSE
ncbi:hypothetical protein JAAARDRAFT_197937 [Jaapia argillacea MUCL 33604]|uniref:Uncharacterized protein n=1 Tax=Jaapia argillacea MUCL 33604 TaxID=933084 RepID=A0A067PG95_9AGAM|nr:hypothetical protein JAAARDRAFT_197937 [Jaapia argillacea MUCL 33604]